MLGLVGITALAAMALVVGGSASADSACLEDPKGGAQGECPEGKVWKGPIIGLAIEVKIGLGALEDTVCKGEFLADWVKNEGAKIGVLYLILTFKLLNCTGLCKNVAVQNGENLPWSLLVLMAPKDPENPADGKEHAILREDGKGIPSILLENCKINAMLLNCLYEFGVESLWNYELEEKESKPLAGAFRINTGLARGTPGDSAMCPDGAAFTGSYLIYEDKESGKEGGELFFTAIP
jgi:hypothetical protein